MPVTKTGICNSALVKVGADIISAITQNTASAIALNAIYDSVRDEELRKHPWNFAIKRALLAPTSTTPTYNFDYEYDVPNDCLRILDLSDDVDSEGDDDFEFQIEGGKLLSNESSLYVRYIRREDDESEWDACFAEVMAWRLAREVAYKLTQSVTLVDAMQKGYEQAIKEARTCDAMEGTMKLLIADKWVDARK
jgi:hypothetical protein